MNLYQAVYEDIFAKNLQCYASKRSQIKKRVERVRGISYRRKLKELARDYKAGIITLEPVKASVQLCKIIGSSIGTANKKE